MVIYTCFKQGKKFGKEAGKAVYYRPIRNRAKILRRAGRSWRVKRDVQEFTYGIMSGRGKVAEVF